MGTLNFFLSLFGWTFIPDFATNHLLNFVYHSVPLITPAQSQEACGIESTMRSPMDRHHLISHVYTVQSSFRDASNFYEILGRTTGVDEKWLNFGFQAFAREITPDKADPSRLFIVRTRRFRGIEGSVCRLHMNR